MIVELFEETEKAPGTHAAAILILGFGIDVWCSFLVTAGSPLLPQVRLRVAVSVVVSTLCTLSE